MVSKLFRVSYKVGGIEKSALINARDEAHAGVRLRSLLTEVEEVGKSKVVSMETSQSGGNDPNWKAKPSGVMVGVSLLTGQKVVMTDARAVRRPF